jgi:hypothetical protein
LANRQFLSLRETADRYSGFIAQLNAPGLTKL